MLFVQFIVYIKDLGICGLIPVAGSNPVIALYFMPRDLRSGWSPKPAVQGLIPWRGAIQNALVAQLVEQRLGKS